MKKRWKVVPYYRTLPGMPTHPLDGQPVDHHVEGLELERRWTRWGADRLTEQMNHLGGGGSFIWYRTVKERVT